DEEETEEAEGFDLFLTFWDTVGGISAEDAKSFCLLSFAYSAFSFFASSAVIRFFFCRSPRPFSDRVWPPHRPTKLALTFPRRKVGRLSPPRDPPPPQPPRDSGP